MTREHLYKGERIVRSDYIQSKRWRIISVHPATGMQYGEVPGEGYYTLAAARAAIDEGQADDARSRQDDRPYWHEMGMDSGMPAGTESTYRRLPDVQHGDRR